VRRAATLLLVIAAGAVAVRGALVAAQPPGAAAIEAARRGGVTIVCRHGITDSFSENEMTLRYDDPATQRRLSPAGERQADSVGRALRALGVPVTEVVASPMDRAQRTAALMVPDGPRVRLDSAWHTRGESYGGPKLDARAALLATPPSVPRGDRLIVSHVGTINSVIPATRGRLEEGDCVVVRPGGAARFEVVGIVPWRAWLDAARPR
jgi:broad specificity phosphatase PhoE